MRAIPVILSFFASALAETAAPVRNEHVNPSTVDDAKANDPAVPDGVTIDAHFQRIAILRFKHKVDLLSAMQDLLKEQRIVNGVILSGIGSTRGYHIHVVGNRTFPTSNIFVKDLEAPADITSVNGYVIGGRVHAHVTLADGEHAFGGHLEPGTEVFTFAIVTVGVLPDDLDLKRIDDKSYR